VTSSLERPLLSPAGAAGLLGCPVWMIDVLVRRDLLSATRVRGTLRIRHRELEALRRTHDPSYRKTEEP
jgi:hypothetical protein